MWYRQRFWPSLLRAFAILGVLVALSGSWQLPSRDVAGQQPPQVIVNPAAAEPATQVAVTGTGWPADTDGRVIWMADGSELATLHTGADGAFQAQVTVPDVDPGSYQLTVTAGTAVVVTSMDVLAPPAPTEVPPPTEEPPTATTAPPTATTEPLTPTIAPTVAPTSTSRPASTAAAAAVSGAQPTTLTFAPVADARVMEARPDSNYGASTTLRVGGGNGHQTVSLLQFNVQGADGAVTQALLRLFVRSGSQNGPAISSAENTWTEGTVTWNTRPVLTSEPIDDQGVVTPGQWLEFDISPFITANGLYTLALTSESSDSVDFSSREFINHVPSLAVTVDPATTPAPTPTENPQPTSTTAPEPTATTAPLPTEGPTATTSAANTEVPVSMVLAPDADARVTESSPNANYGSYTSLVVDVGSGANKESYLRFTIPASAGSIQQATLRLTVRSSGSSGTSDGPAVFSAENDWTENGITWNNRPTRSTTPYDDKGALVADQVVDFDVTPLVTGSGAVTFVLAQTSTDGVVFCSRECATGQPQLLLGDVAPAGSPTPTQTPNPPAPTSTPTSTPTPTPTAAATASPLPGGSLTLPIRATFYYSGYPEDWTQGGVTPDTNYDPSLGLYDSGDPTVIAKHIAAMQYG
ncbi:MAG TPA: DNRLRE domain-containing protein, partial [Thermomicrobiales bacterium]|nr:DNRLRE domain-containing protein [Thermomicrobiales bacterium]